MASSADADPEIPAAVRPQWEELTEQAIPARAAALTEARQQTARCKRLIVELLAGGVRRDALIHRPFSQGWLTRIQRDAGLTRKRRTGQDGGGA